MMKWPLVVLVIGLGIAFWDYSLAKKKKEGFTRGDKDRVMGIFWFSFVAAAGVGALIWFAQDLV
jgi:hypothetical protein